MNKRIAKKIKKRKINTPARYIGTGGHLTPYMCPNCKVLYSYKTAFETQECISCGQKLIWWDADPAR